MQKKFYQRPIGKYGLIILLIIGCFVIMLMIVDKVQNNHAKNAMDTIENAQFSGQQIVSTVRDVGCNASDTGWIGSHTTCAYHANRIFKAHGKVEEDIKEADRILQSMGWEREEFLDKNFAQSGMVTYRQYDPGSTKLTKTINLFFFVPQADGSGITAQQAIKDRTQADVAITLAPGEYIYGMHVVHVYRSWWSL